MTYDIYYKDIPYYRNKISGLIEPFLNRIRLSVKSVTNAQ